MSGAGRGAGVAHGMRDDDARYKFSYTHNCATSSSCPTPPFSSVGIGDACVTIHNIPSDFEGYLGPMLNKQLAAESNGTATNGSNTGTFNIGTLDGCWKGVPIFKSLGVEIPRNLSGKIDFGAAEALAVNASVPGWENNKAEVRHACPGLGGERGVVVLASCRRTMLS